jgi:predicted membrane channel-forming protein YqfA (hemolysin III family)
MERWTYYSPLWLGALLVLALNDALRSALPIMAPWASWLIVAGAAVLAGLQSQVLMVGAQGAFAQVLPVPRGRSIRGGAAAAAGWLLIAWVLLSGVTVLLSCEAVTQAAVVLGVLSVVALAAAIVIYAWNIPAAVADFGSDRR